MRFVASLAVWLVVSLPALAQTKIVARGDFDGDGRPDTVETGRIRDLADLIRPGDPNDPAVQRSRAIYASSPDWEVGIFVRLAAEPDRARMMGAMTESSLEKVEVVIAPPGEQAFHTDLGPYKKRFDTDVVILRRSTTLGRQDACYAWVRSAGRYGLVGVGLVE